MLLDLAIFLSITITPIILQMLHSKQNTKSIKNGVHKCIFTDPKNVECRFHIYKNESCGSCCVLLQLKEIVSFISTAKQTVHLCMYILTCEEITYELVKCAERGLSVCVIIDQEMVGTTGSKVSVLKNAGIIVRKQPRNGSLMHHKFCVIDAGTDYQKMFFGSLNLTLQGLTRNWDDIVFTRDTNIVNRFEEEFNELWRLFENQQ